MFVGVLVPVVEVKELPVDPAVETVEIPSELVCAVPNVETVPVGLGEKLTVDVTGVVPTNLNKKRRYENNFPML